MKRLASVLFWSVIAAAFIGPGTVTTAALAGNRHGLVLLWALLFSTIACAVLQEASARLTVTSGRDLAATLGTRAAGAGWFGLGALAAGAVILGCAAYQAGNILGAVAGARLAVDVDSRLLVLGCGVAAGVVLWPGRPSLVARSMGALVAVMGVAFLMVAVALRPEVGALATGLLVPTLPTGATLVVLGLVGTTVVPYNLFLGSGLARGQLLGELRFGLTVAIGIGGLISMAVVVAGTAVVGELSFESLASVLEQRFGRAGRGLLAVGLLAAGLSSAITAPLAAAITARSVWARGDEGWSTTTWRFRAVWGAILLVGVGFGLAGLQPIPVIVAAQALNGLVLPLVAVFLLLAVNDPRLMGARLNGVVGNALMAGVVVVTLLLGALQLLRAVSRVFDLELEAERVFALAAVGALAALFPVARELRRRRWPRESA